MKKITIKNQVNNYDVLVDYNAIEILKYLKYPNKTLVIYDSNCPIDTICNNLPNDIDKYQISESENSKSFTIYQTIIELLINKEYTRNDLIIAIGGGATLDLSGFVASTYKRGLNVIYIPTTLLAMVDASIGGKTAINFSGIKNMIGTFYMPNLVICSTNLLDTLSKRDLVSGLMEALKMGLIIDKKLYDLIKTSDINLIRLNPYLLEDIIVRSIKAKKKIVEIDPYEEGIRKYLNFGHTIGHAIEALNFGKINHGEAVALGMLPFTNNDIKVEVKEIIKEYLDDLEINLNKEELIKFIKEDKKRFNNNITCVCVDKIGKCYLEDFTIEDLEEKLNEISIW